MPTTGTAPITTAASSGSPRLRAFWTCSRIWAPCWSRQVVRVGVIGTPL